MAGKLEGKTALVTGAGSGIGLATVKRFVSEGAFVYMADKDKSRLEAEARNIGKQVYPIVADVTKSSDLDALYEVISDQNGRLDVLFANAGIGAFCQLDEISEEYFDRIFDVNVKGVLFTVQKALPVLVDGGSVILTGSIQSVRSYPSFSVYGASKAAISCFARGWTNDLKNRRIRVNAVCPGVIETPAIASLFQTEEALQSFYEETAATVPLGRPGTPDDIAKAAVFLASDDAGYVTGVELFVDGGAVQV